MSRIAAFVGHSFSEADSEVVSRFLSFFDHVQELTAIFSWDHAEEAEPKILSQKVKEKMEGKNLFIGICTVKELAVNPKDLSSSFFLPGQWYGQRDKFEAKTSDWITQEVGFAIAKGMHLILLLEEGVRRPGGLQGDTEYIPFKRSKPAESFEKILEMIKSLAPKVMPIEQSASSLQSEETKTETPEGNEDRRAEPAATWTRSDYEDAVFMSVIDGDEQRRKGLIESYRESGDGQTEIERDALEAYSIWMGHMMRRKGAELSRLQELESKHPTDPRFKRYLGKSYETYSAHDKAMRALVAAADLETDIQLKLFDLTEAAYQKARSGDEKAESWYREKYAAFVGTTEKTYQTFRRGLWGLAGIREQDDTWIAYQEARLLDVPDDFQERFSLAYKYSEKDNQALALYHYLMISAANRTDLTWNNIGASYRALEINAHGVAAYRRSQELGGTYAMSNLAYLLIETGFFPEAETMCNEALRMEKCEKRVAAALSSIEDKNKQEEELVKKTKAAAQTEHQYMAKLGNAMCSEKLPDGISTWFTPKCPLTVTVDGDKFSAVGRYERESQTSLGILMSTGKVQKKTFEVIYEGKVSGRGVSFSKREVEQGTSPSLFESLGESGFLIIEEGLQSAQEIDKWDKKATAYLNWTRT